MQNNINSIDISVLIPVFNHCCVSLVTDLQHQLDSFCQNYEIIVADDGSTDKQTIKANSAIDSIPHSSFIVRDRNVGRAAIRNILALNATGKWLLFLDCDINIPDDSFISTYMSSTDGTDVIYGGISTEGNDVLRKTNLRYIYEHASESSHTASERAKQPYRSFRTTNFMIQRDVMLDNLFDERIKHYGYEDVLFGKQLQQKGCTIKHIENPVAISEFESNNIFMEKTEESLRTLFTFREELHDYSKLLTAAAILTRFIPAWFFRTWHSLFGHMERSNLTGKRPVLRLFNLYRLGYYLSLTNKALKQ